MEEEVEKYVVMHGEKYRKLIYHALAFLNAREPVWKLDEPIDRDAYIQDLVDKSYDPPPKEVL